MKNIPLISLITFLLFPRIVLAADSCSGATTVPTPSLPPFFDRDIQFVKEDGKTLTREFVPALRTTQDGRIGLKVKIDNGGTNLKIFLQNPEKVTSAPAPGSVSFWDKTHPSTSMDTFDLTTLNPPEWNDLSKGLPFQLRHVTVCDVKGTNPTYNSVDKTDDYTFNIVGFSGVDDAGKSSPSPFGIWKLNVTVRIKNPKTAMASFFNSVNGKGALKINSISSAGLDLGKYYKQFLEPMITNDGRLLVGRLGGATIPSFSDSKTRYNIVYSYNSSANPCDISGWTKFKPILYAPYDPELKAANQLPKYGLARYPFRDGRGKYLVTNYSPAAIPDLLGSYPWIDRAGNNLFFNVLKHPLVTKFNGDQSANQYANKCLPGINNPCTEDIGNAKGTNMMGLWTHGKAVMFDSAFNPADYGMGTDIPSQRYFTNLYAGQPHDLRVASVREVSTLLINSAVNNINIMDSMENLFNFNPYIKPRTPRDLVWRIGRGHVSQEVIFDDYIDPHVLVYAPMNAAWDGQSGRYLDGFLKQDPTLSCNNILGNFQYWGSSEIRLQNAATAVKFPDNTVEGTVSGKARVEPVALGGVEGRGLYLDGKSSAQFRIDSEVKSNRSWYVGVFHHYESSKSFPAYLLSVPGKFDFYYKNNSNIVLKTAHTTQTFVIPTFSYYVDAKNWKHWGLVVNPQEPSISIYLNGNLWKKVPISTQDNLSASFRPSSLVLGSSQSGIKGWTDELKLIINIPINSEVICNHARGTMIGYKAGKSDANWVNYQNNFIRPVVSGYENVGCYVAKDFEGPAIPPTGSAALRDRLTMKNFFANTPRPDMHGNQFCLSCHITGKDGSSLYDPNRSPSLTPTVLEPTKKSDGSYYIEREDPVRRPSQPPIRVFGFAPAGYINGINPTKNTNCSPNKLACYIDDWLLPSK